MSNSTQTTESQEDLDREVVESDVTFVGAGPACLAGAIHLHNLIEIHNEKADLDQNIAQRDGICLLYTKNCKNPDNVAHYV